MGKRSIKTSDLGSIHWSNDGTVGVWKFQPTSFVIMDRGNRSGISRSPLDSSTFRASVTWDPEDRWSPYTVVTCGTNGKGATRYRGFATGADATMALLAWLDRRFKVVVDA